MKTPLYSALLEYSETNPVRFHMPGHKGNPLYSGIWGDIAALDVTELPQTGDLYREESGAIREAERLLAKTYGAKSAVFLTGGSTQGVFAMLASNTSPGNTILVDRLCHYSVASAMALLDLHPVYIYRNITNGIASPVDPAEVGRLLTPDIKTVLLTSPTYNGVCSNLKSIYDTCESNGTKLLLDAAHGAHLPFVPGFYDYFRFHHAVMSAHKTLPALGQAAFLLTSDAEPLRRAAMLTGTSSPSYPIMASIDLARAFLDERGMEQGRLLYETVINSGNDYTLLSRDPLRITVKVECFADVNIVPEMSVSGMSVFIISLYDSVDAVRALFSAVSKCGGAPFNGKSSRMPHAKAAMTLRQAMFSPDKITLAAKNAVGRVAAEPIAPFPPGVPLLMPGEIFEEEHLEYVTPESVYCFIG